MRTPSTLFYVAVASVVSLAIFTGCGTTSTVGSSTTASAAPTGNAAHLTIFRAPNFGTLHVLNVFVDGKNVANVVRGGQYDGSLAPGSHVLSVTVDSSNDPSAGVKKTIVAQKGQTYSFTASWDGGGLQLL